MKLHCYLYIVFTIATSSLQSQAPSILWNMSFGGNESEIGKDMESLNDGSFLSVGHTGSDDGDVDSNAGGADIYLVKVSSSNELVFSKTFGGSDTDYGNSITESYDGGYLIGGLSTSIDGIMPGNYGEMDAIILKTDSLGNLEWIKNYGGSNDDEVLSVIRSVDSGYIFTGFSGSIDFDISDHIGLAGVHDVIVGKIDTLGNLIWLKSYGSTGSDRGNQIIKTKDSCYLICGYRNFVFSDYYILKIDSNGEILWEKTYGGSEFDGAYSIYELSSGNIVVCGETTSDDGDVGFLNGFSDSWVIFLDSAGNLLWERSYGGSGAETGYQIFETFDSAILVTSIATNGDGDVTGHHEGTGGDYWVIKIDTIGVIQWGDCYGGTEADYCYGSAQLVDSSYVITGMSWSNDGDVIGHHDGVVENTDLWTIRIKETCNQEKYYADSDSDGFGHETIYTYSCFDTVGYVLNNLDCNDTIAAINPLAKDICNDIDDNCNGEIDENSLFVLWYEDSDGDTFGNANIDSLTCHTLEGFVLDSTDCNDESPLIYPGATEILNGIDDDCDQIADDGLDVITSIPVTLNVFPNPALLEITFQFNNLQNPSLLIFTITGELLMHQTSVISPMTIDITSFAPGVYFVELIDNSNSAIGVFVKN